MTQTVITKGHKGVQKGGSASSVASSNLDSQLKNTAKKLQTEMAGFSKGHTKKRPLFDGVFSGCVPDGGLWLDSKGKVRVALEAKVQGNHGNAQERHSKNLMICEAFKSEEGFRYVTFMAGAGAKPGGVLDTFAKTTLRCRNPEGSRDVNIIHKTGVSFLLSETGWTTDEIERLMREALAG
jgi:hypothetical protein